VVPSPAKLNPASIMDMLLLGKKRRTATASGAGTAWPAGMSTFLPRTFLMLVADSVCRT
jgi:hypothetical protein